jgi:hypothetical protein
MTRPDPLTLVSLALLGAGIYLAWPNAERPRARADGPYPIHAQSVAERGPLALAASLPIVAGRTEDPRASTAEDGGEGSAREPDQAELEAPSPIGRYGHLAAPRPYVAKRLGWAPDDPRLDFLSRWLGDRRTAERELVRGVAHSGGADQLRAMEAYNRASEAWRLQLCQQLGAAAAEQVVERFCMYRFEPGEGSWYRVDAAGARAPFRHEDDDIWQRGECSNPSWDGHW